MEGDLALLASIAFMGAAALVIGVGGYITLASLWRLRQPVPAELGAMLARQGLDWARLAGAGALHELSFGLARCAECRARPQCRDWLASGRREGYQAFCANAALVERMKGAAAH